MEHAGTVRTLSTSTVDAELDVPKKKELGSAAPPHAWPRMSRTQSVLLVVNLTLAMTLNIMNVQAVVISLPSIAAELNIRDGDLQWLVSSYSLTFGCFLLLAGRLSDLYGHKKVFLAGTSWFCLWSIGCGLAPSEIGMDVMRALQGMGAAAAIGIIAHSFPPGPSKSTAFACFSAGAALGGSLGTITGGLLTEYAPVGWRAIFYVSAGLAAGISILGMLVIPKDARMDLPDQTVDWIGAGLATGGLVLLTFSLAAGDGAPNGWATPYIPVLFVLSIFLLAAFILWEYHVENRTNRTPLMRLSLFRKGRFALIQLIALLGWSCFSSHQFFATLYYQQYRGLSPLLTMIRFIPMSITGLILNFTVAVVAAYCPAQVLIVLGAFGTSMAPLLFILIPAAGAVYWRYEFPAMVLTVFGADFIFATGIMYGSKVAAADEQALAGGIFNTVTQVGTAIGLAITSIINKRVTTSATTSLGAFYDPNDAASFPPAALLKGLRAALWGCFAFGIVSLLIAVVGLRGIGTVGEKPQVLSRAEVVPELKEEAEERTLVGEA